MRGIIISTFLFLVSLGAFAQSWAPIGAEWHYESKYPWHNYYEYFYFKSVKDTVVLGKVCKKIVGDEEWSCSPRSYLRTHNPLVTYESNDSIFILFYTDSTVSFQLHYNWNAKRGDTYLVRNVVQGLNDSITVRIDSVETVNVNGVNLRKQYVSHLNAHWTSTDPHIYLERIGDIGYYFYATEFGIGGCDQPYPVGLRCYEDTVLGLYMRIPSVSCNQKKDFSSINEEEVQNNVLSIFPNPTINYLNIITESGNYDVLIYNSYGQLNVRNSHYGKSTIDVSMLTSGLYFVQVLNSQGQTMSRSIVKR